MLTHTWKKIMIENIYIIGLCWQCGICLVEFPIKLCFCSLSSAVLMY